MTGFWNMDPWEGFFNQSAVGTFGSKVNKGRICTKGQDKYFKKKEIIKLGISYLKGVYIFINFYELQKYNMF